MDVGNILYYSHYTLFQIKQKIHKNPFSEKKLPVMFDQVQIGCRAIISDFSHALSISIVGQYLFKL